MILLFGTALLVGCTQSATGPTTSTLAPLRTIDITPPTTLPVPTNTSATIGYVVLVVNGSTFDLQQGPALTQRYVIPHIQVPDVGTCEGELSRALLASMIHGKQVRITPDGVVWRMDDVDVGMTMVAYGYASHVGEWYQFADTNSEDINCANTTTTLAPAPVVIVPQTRPRPVRTTVGEAPAETVAVTEPVTETAPPNAAPEPPRETDPPKETEPERPKETKPPKDEPKATDPPAQTDEPDRTPRTPRPPRTPDVPNVTG